MVKRLKISYTLLIKLDIVVQLYMFHVTMISTKGSTFYCSRQLCRIIFNNKCMSLHYIRIVTESTILTSLVLLVILFHSNQQQKILRRIPSKPLRTSSSREKKVSRKEFLIDSENSLNLNKQTNSYVLNEIMCLKTRGTHTSQAPSC